MENYLSNSDMKEIDELYIKWWTENPYELKSNTCCMKFRISLINSH